ncbi:ABC transporter permease [Adhaeribacter rhizoryzae]|uniref:FtsX-like permease family protein n=1 Tax=Adhaeribacter rhizoryzae TaxID=2607907 RepID=A0A5M6D5Q3_9BACT|nr:ABC transporter permease [Adhaeribacter rhizoryzae]KAA5542838.1 FtsX-like permease family protein [Adhaeribacter rhizoryzae]
MFRNYFKIALRNFVKHKTYSVINLAGLGIAITCCLLLGLFLQQEWRFDRFHSKADRLYRPWVREIHQNEPIVNTITPYPLGPAMVAALPEVEAMTRIVTLDVNTQRNGDIFNERVHLVEPDFFRMFDFPLLNQPPGNPLTQLKDAVLTEEIAQKYFGNQNPIGQTFRMQLDSAMETYTVRAVAKNVPANSSIRFGILLSFENIKPLRSQKQMNHWQQVEAETYVLLKSGVEVKQVAAKLPAMVKTATNNKFKPGEYVVNLQPITAIHLDNTLPQGIEPVSNPAYSYILATIALFILVIACINFMTLAIGRSAGRAREVGVRKVMGAIRQQLVYQFWGEALLMTLAAVVVGVLLTVLLLPAFNELADRQLIFKLDSTTLLSLFVLVAVVGLVAGSYPALVLSRFQPVEVLKGKLTLKGDQNWFRRTLVVVQFGLSVFLMVGTLVMNRQLNYLQAMPLGFKTDRTVVIPVNKGGEEGLAIVERYRNALSSHKEIANITASAFAFGTGAWADVGFNDKNKVFRSFQMNMIDPEFIPVYNIKLVAGRNFDQNNTADKYTAFIINEAFVKAFGLPDPLNQKLPGDFPAHQIIGVVEDFHYASLHSKVEPLLLVQRPDSLFAGINDLMFQSSPDPDISVRLQPGAVAEQVALLEQTWKKVLPDEPFSYTFLDENIASQYQQEKRLGTIVTIASGLSIFISCLGLFGLATLAVARRTKEIGVRKVLGASVGDIISLLSKDFIALVVVANILAWPLAWYGLHQWLQDFAYRVDVGWWLFGLAGAATLLIALLTVSFHSVRAALVNPVKSLRTE